MFLYTNTWPLNLACLAQTTWTGLLTRLAYHILFICIPVVGDVSLTFRFVCEFRLCSYMYSWSGWSQITQLSHSHLFRLPGLTCIGSDVCEHSNGSHTQGDDPQWFSHSYQVLIIFGLGHWTPTFLDWHIGCSWFLTPPFSTHQWLLLVVGHIFHYCRHCHLHTPGLGLSLRGLCGLLLLLLGF